MAFNESGDRLVQGGSDVGSESFLRGANTKKDDALDVEELFQGILREAEEAGVPPLRFIEGVLCALTLGRGEFFAGKSLDDAMLYKLYGQMADFIHDNEEKHEGAGG